MDETLRPATPAARHARDHAFNPVDEDLADARDLYPHARSADAGPPVESRIRSVALSRA